MPERPNIPDAPPALRALLEALPEGTGGFLVTQHQDIPRPGEWFAGWNGGDVGPYATAEAAIAGGIRWMFRRWQEAETRARAAEDDAERLRERLDRPDAGLDRWASAAEG